MALSPVLLRQIERLQAKYPGASIEELPSGVGLVVVPEVSIPKGWTQSTTTIRFLAPVGYPAAQPDCFWVDPGFGLEGGGVPQNANPQVIPETEMNCFWFSWHIGPGQWKPNRDDLLTYIAVIMNRLGQLQ